MALDQDSQPRLPRGGMPSEALTAIASTATAISESADGALKNLRRRTHGPRHSLKAAAFGFAGRISRVLAPFAAPIRRYGLRAWHWIKPWCEAQPLWRWCTKSIGRRILAAHLVGFSILFVGLMFVSQANKWMIDAKVESLTTQAQMIAIAIASNAKADTGGFTLEVDRLPDASGAPPLARNDTFAAMELSIAPERVAPILGRLIQVGDIRARIYGRDGYLILDSNQRLLRGQISRSSSPAQPKTDPAPDEKIKTFWTSMFAWFVRSDLKVYRDVGTDRGTIYPEVGRALEGNVTRMLLVNSAGAQIVAVAAPILHLGAVQGVVQLSSRPGDIDELQWRQRRALLVLSLMALLASLFAAWLLSRTIAGPMRRLSEAAEQVSHNINAERDLPDFPGRRDEVGLMAAAFRDMTASLYRRIEASDRFAQDVAHELKNPVAAARSTAESLAYAKSDQQRAELVKQIQDEMKRLNRLITDVAKASRLDAELALQETEPLNLAQLATGMVGVLSDIHCDEGRQIKLDLQSGPADAPTYVVSGHEIRLGQVLTNLIDNALSFSPEDGVVSVGVCRIGDEVVVTVDDEGPGIPPDRLDHVFKRFYSDRPQSDRTKGKNSGLGLSISREIVLAHGGRIHAENRMAPAGSQAEDRLGPELKERRISGVIGARFVVGLRASDAGGIARRL
jgi:two-component system sensor histidine kinase ChvG